MRLHACVMFFARMRAFKIQKLMYLKVENLVKCACTRVDASGMRTSSPMEPIKINDDAMNIDRTAGDAVPEQIEVP